MIWHLLISLPLSSPTMLWLCGPSFLPLDYWELCTCWLLCLSPFLLHLHVAASFSSLMSSLNVLSSEMFSLATFLNVTHPSYPAPPFYFLLGIFFIGLITMCNQFLNLYFIVFLPQRNVSSTGARTFKFLFSAVFPKPRAVPSS